MNSLTASLPFELLAAVRAAFVMSGTTLNLFSGKKPAARRPRLYRERCLELQEIQQVGLQPLVEGQTE